MALKIDFKNEKMTICVKDIKISFLYVDSYVCLFVTEFTLTEVMPCSIQGNSWQSTHSGSATEVTGITVLYCEHIILEFPIGHLTQI